MTHPIARPVAMLSLVIVVGACGAPTPPAATVADEVVDGYAIGPARTVSGDEFHRLEVTARDVARTRWPGLPMTRIDLAAAGTLADGSIQAGTEGPSTFLVVIDVNGAGRHAFVLQCDDATFPAPDSCAATSNESS
jgi:hypothetical protein